MNNIDLFCKEKDRYISEETNEKLPVVYQLMIWNTIDSLRKSAKQMEKTQVFIFKTLEEADVKRNNTRIIQVTHLQEQLGYKKTYEFPINKSQNNINGKVCVTDEGSRIVMTCELST